MAEERVLKLSLSKINKPYTDISVKEYDLLHIDGSKFPLNGFIDNEPLKMPMSIEDLVGRLRSHDVIIQPEEEKMAKDFIFKTNYYKLSIFTRYLNTDKNLSALIDLYNFDKYLSESLFNLIAPIEIYLKASLANFLSTNYSEITKKEKSEEIHPSLVYLDETIYKSKEVENKEVLRMLSNFSQMLEKKIGKDLTIDHHIKKYGGNIPIWVLVEHLTLGEFGVFLIKLDRPILKKWTEENIKSSWQKAINEWINTIRILRNSAAHNNRFYGRYFNFSPIIPDEYDDSFNYGKEIEDKEKQRIKNTLFAGFIIIKEFYNSLGNEDQKRWNEFLTTLKTKLEKNSTLNIRSMKFPENWYEVLIISHTDIS